METVDLSNWKKSEVAVSPEMADACFTCGTCASGCPATGLVPGWDPRRAIRAITMGLEQELIDSKFPWVCTGCWRCQHACPQGVLLGKTFRAVRAKRERDKVPGPLHKGTIMNREKGNNLGIPRDDFLTLLAELSVELMEDDEEQPCPGFYVPVDKEGANIIVTINSKEPFAEPDDMKYWWKIFYAAKEDWTVSSVNWEGVNWGMFTGDDENMKIQVARVLENARRLKAKTILLPEWGHAYFATRFGLKTWFPEAYDEFKVVSIYDVLVDYLQSGRIKLNKARFAGHKVTLHEPCNYFRKSQIAFGQEYSKEYRYIVNHCFDETDIVEMHPHGLNNHCCGAGGGAWAMPYTEERLAYGKIKADQIKETGAQIVIAPCHNCRDQIMKGLFKKFDMGNYKETLYLWELVAEALIIEPWNNDEVQKAHALRDAQYERDGVEMYLEEQ